MLIQAPEIQIDAADHRLLIIRNKFLGMHKARCILIDLYARLQQLRIIRPCNRKDNLFVRYMRQDQLDIHTSSRCIGQCCDQLIVNDQIRCHDVHVLLCLVQHIQINALCNIKTVDRVIIIGNHIAGRRRSFKMRKILFILAFSRLGHIPHL